MIIKYIEDIAGINGKIFYENNTFSAQYISYFMTIVFIDKWINRPVASHWQTNENWKRNFNTIGNDIIVI